VWFSRRKLTRKRKWHVVVYHCTEDGIRFILPHNSRLSFMNFSPVFWSIPPGTTNSWRLLTFIPLKPHLIPSHVSNRKGYADTIHLIISSLSTHTQTTEGERTYWRLAFSREGQIPSGSIDLALPPPVVVHPLYMTRKSDLKPTGSFWRLWRIVDTIDGHWPPVSTRKCWPTVISARVRDKPSCIEWVDHRPVTVYNLDIWPPA